MDAEENPFQSALEELPALLLRYKAKQMKLKKDAEERVEDKMREMNGEPPIFRDKSNEIIKDLLDISAHKNFACDKALGMKKTIPIVKTYESYVNYKSSVIKDVTIAVNQKLLKMQGSDSKVVEKIGNFFSNVSKFIY